MGKIDLFLGGRCLGFCILLFAYTTPMHRLGHRYDTIRRHNDLSCPKQTPLFFLVRNEVYCGIVQTFHFNGEKWWYIMNLHELISRSNPSSAQALHFCWIYGETYEFYMADSTIRNPLLQPARIQRVLGSQGRPLETQFAKGCKKRVKHTVTTFKYTKLYELVFHTTSGASRSGPPSTYLNVVTVFKK